MPAPDDRSRGRRPASGRSGKPDAGGGRTPAGRGGKPNSRGGKPDARGGKPDARGAKSDSRGGKPAYNRDRSKDRTRSTSGQWRRDELPEAERTAAQAAYDGPPIPDDITGKELDPHVLAQLKSLPEKLAARVARHLVAAAQLMDSDPETAYRHTLAARARASRVSVVREASGEAAYAAGKFKEALTEFKAARRMNHNPMYLPMMADCERGLGRPDRALTLAKDPQVVELDDAGQIEMKIVESGARRDLGDAPAAIRVLEGRELRSRSRASWVPRLRYAYAEALLADGQVAAAREWFERAAGVDADGYTDAAERLEALGDEGIS
jgi:tetratricopeptide (TPR) repeat protein